MAVTRDTTNNTGVPHSTTSLMIIERLNSGGFVSAGNAATANGSDTTAINTQIHWLQRHSHSSRELHPGITMPA